ncbi:biotrophy-associated secreted protein 2 [Colletotrichum graminicola M1.001]|uniref:Biotrophy-associated secreted protein 2 n=1 Tax=Colletotrichum graminicola (strain M1.001 / M2 / FGSC 10212) TaxID=645133 RepID=E3QJV2_COLGM|nr:biotrophy-associated secreted protein 2 [Colletotrichum graminicola M1.001]EFQ31140.1 biotrophy-associated secreted protein 2 [Colletotrichum graminicola M1.001]
MVRITLFATIAFAATAFSLSPNNAGARNVGKGDGSQFITGGCVDNADCSSACCANLSGVGICSAEAAQFQNGKKGCNFVDPNKDATIAAAKAQVKKQGF